MKPSQRKRPLPPPFPVDREDLFIEWFLDFKDDDETADVLGVKVIRLQALRRSLEKEGITEDSFLDTFLLSTDGQSLFNDYLTVREMAKRQQVISNFNDSNESDINWTEEKIDTLKMMNRTIRTLNDLIPLLRHEENYPLLVKSLDTLTRLLERKAKLTNFDPALIQEEYEEKLNQVRQELQDFIQFVISLGEKYDGLVDDINNYLFGNDDGKKE